jgi:alpha-galactosidase
MNQKFKLILLILLVSFSTAFGQKKTKTSVYDARTSDWQILTPAAPETPRINGPKIYGARAGKHFIYRIPCEGKRPIQFTAEGLPSGLVLDAANGIITGITPSAKDTFNIVFTATNNKGKASRDFKLVIGDKIALTPPMGWNSWGGHMLLVTDEVMRKAADIMVNKGLADVGFQYVSIDDCWMRIAPEVYETRKEMYARRTPGYPYEKVVGPVRDECGDILTNDFFPDMKAMTDHIHSHGLKAGIYSGPGPETCQLFVSSFGHEASDARQFADWGFDLLKYDMCSYRDIMTRLQKTIPAGSPEIGEITIWHPMSEFLLQQDRDILYNLCQYGRQDPWKWAPALNIQTWRTGMDLNHNVKSYFEGAMFIIKDLREYSKPGQWNDPDFMYIGKIHDFRNKMAPPQEIPLNTNQRYQYVSLWSLIAAPYFFSANMNEIDEFTISLLRNADLANVNQDELGHVAEIIRETENHIILSKKLVDGSVAVGIFNTSSEADQVLNLTWSELGMSGEKMVRDLWRQKDLGKMKEGISVNISPQGCAVFTIK